MLVEINNNINYIKTLWDFSNVHTQTEKNQKLDLCISAYFGTTENQWLWISISVFIISICSLLALKSPNSNPISKNDSCCGCGHFFRKC